MKIAVSAQDNNGLDSLVSHHFGRCPYFVLAGVDDGGIVDHEVIDNPHWQNHRPGEVPAFIASQSADVVICGGMGRRAIAHFSELRIDAATGASGTARTAIEQYLSRALPEATPCRESVEHAGEGGHPHHDGW